MTILVVGLSKPKEYKLDITADDKIFTPRGVGALNIGIVQCLSELIANSLDWRRFTESEQARIRQELKTDPGSKEAFARLYGALLEVDPVDTVVKIDYTGDSIELLDNGIGMTLDELQVGLKLRAASDDRREPLRSRKGMFGMGMKVGILGTGWKFTIRSRSILDSKESVIEIDTREIENGQLSLKEIIGKVYDEHQTSGPLANLESGTHIEIADLHKKKHRPETWREKIGRNFSPEIKFEGVQILVADSSFDDESEEMQCFPEEVDILPNTIVELDSKNLMVKTDLGTGKRGKPLKITGWIGLRVKSASGSGLWGLHTFRKGQLVEAYHKGGPPNGLLPKNPHPTMARLHGEIHLDMCDPNFTKVGWNTELESWSDAKEALRPILEEMIKAAQSHRTKKGGGAKSRKMVQRARSIANEAVSTISRDNDEDAPKDRQNYVAIDDGKYLKVSVTQQAITYGESFWDYSYRDESKEIAVVVNTDSNLWKQAKESRDAEGTASLIVRWAIVDCLYFCLVNDLMFEPNRALHLRDKWHAELYRGDEDE